MRSTCMFASCDFDCNRINCQARKTLARLLRDRGNRAAFAGYLTVIQN